MNMINNLFSIFDPSTSIFKLNWLIIIIPLLIPRKIWKINSKRKTLFNLLKTTISRETQQTTKPKSNLAVTIQILPALVIIILINFSGLFPYIFTPTSHLVLNLPLALILWLSLIIFGWVKSPKIILAHIVPTGTPTALLPFIVIIEIMSNIIRPITLSVRLTANIIAGHLMLSLLGNAIQRINKLMVISAIPVIVALIILEIAVSLIQAYVFTTLTTLYTNEVH
jgi:F-type H+-transporting ATPase subunit a